MTCLRRWYIFNNRNRTAIDIIQPAADEREKPSIGQFGYGRREIQGGSLSHGFILMLIRSTNVPTSR